MWRSWELQQHRSEVNSDYQSAKLCAVMCNLQRSSESQAAEMKDFLLYDQPVKHEQTAEQMLAMVDLLVDGFNGKRVVN